MKDDAKPYHAKLYLIPIIYKQVFKAELNRLKSLKDSILV